MRVDELMVGNGREKLPYALMWLASPVYAQGCWLPVSRDYKRPGEGEGWSNHEAYIDSALVFARDPRLLSGIWTETCADACYLFNSQGEPAADYEERLQRLLQLQGEHWFFHGRPPAAGR